MLRKPFFSNGPLGFLLVTEDIEAVEPSRLHRLLLAYYRVLQANRELPNILLWPVVLLSKLFWTPHPDTGVRLLAIRCYALQSGMGEAEKEKLETTVLGDRLNVDCGIEFGADVDRNATVVDGWVMPFIEATRVTCARNAIAHDPQNY